MRWSVNLRGDLAKLDPEALNDRLERLVAEHEHIRTKPVSLRHPFPARSPDRMRWRGPFRAVLFYKILCLIGGEFFWSSSVKLYLIECEMKDILDKYRRRINDSD